MHYTAQENLDSRVKQPDGARKIWHSHQMAKGHATPLHDVTAIIYSV